MRKLFTFMLCVLLLAACSENEGSETPTTSPDPTPIVPTQATRGPGYPADSQSGYPTYPGGEGSVPDQELPTSQVTFPGQIVFHSERAGAGLQLYLLEGSSDSPTLLTAGPAQAYEPVWSPDCQSILYASQQGSADIDLHLLTVADRLSLPFLSQQRPDTMEWAPAWAGTGDRIAFQTNPGSIPTVCLADGSGGNVGCLQSGQTGSGHPALSPDGTQMAYISNEDGDWDIFIVDVANLGAPRKLTDNGQVDQHPRFSPDGQTILFQSNPYSTFDLFTMRTDGSELTQLTFSVEDEVDGEWVGSDRIVYSGLQGADYELMMMDRDGQNQVRLTDSEGMDGGPAWCAAN